MRKQVFLVAFLFISCQEVYHPKLDNVRSGLVVQGMITNLPGFQTIRLSRTIPFNEEGTNPETGATVYVTDQNGTRYIFAETFPGNYTSDSAQFKPAIGNTYQLNVITKDQSVYISTPQYMLSSGKIDSITAEYAVKTMTNATITGGIRNLPGLEFIAHLRAQEDSLPYFRFESKEFITYTLKEDTSRFRSFCWLKYNAADYFVLLSLKNITGFSQHTIGFCPKDSGFYGIVMTKAAPDWCHDPSCVYYFYRTPVKFIITIKQYHINKEIFDYYQSLNNQLEARQRIFDPILYQAQGNITCTSNPEEQVFGIFETSPVSMYTYEFNPYMSDKFVLIPIQAIDIDKLPPANCTKNSIPDFWTLNK